MQIRKKYFRIRHTAEIKRTFEMTQYRHFSIFYCWIFKTYPPHLKSFASLEHRKECSKQEGQSASESHHDETTENKKAEQDGGPGQDGKAKPKKAGVLPLENGRSSRNSRFQRAEVLKT